jgi:Microtubule-binding stalk of dynein motor
MSYTHYQVKTQSEVIAREKALADEALMEALPAVEAAAAALENLDKKDLDEIKAFTNPPQLVKDVCMQVCTIAFATTVNATAFEYLFACTLACTMKELLSFSVAFNICVLCVRACNMQSAICGLRLRFVFTYS